MGAKRLAVAYLPVLHECYLILQWVLVHVECPIFSVESELLVFQGQILVYLGVHFQHTFQQ
ncbi:unnamed protein product [Meloidogyne enterolobii]|uniref:Uncharacterized protein n=1 Tax=Meloidogyne enterolobii TaxID=390850 RepID=A0ACB0XWG0_MELEN